MLQQLPIRRLLLLSAVLRLLTIPIIRSYSHPISWEFGFIARLLADGQGYSYFTYHHARIPTALMPPGYPLLLAAAFRLFGSGKAPWLILNLIQAVLGTLLVLLVYQLSLQLYRRELLARLSALLVALYPPFVYMCNEYHSINLYIVLGTGAVLYLDRARQLPFRSFDVIKAALFMGALLLFRAEALALFVVYTALLFASSSCHRLRHAVTYVVVSLFFLLPWAIRNQHVFHRFIPTTTSLGLNLWIGNNPQSSGSDRGHSQELPPDLLARFQALPPTPDNEIIRGDALVQASTTYIRTHPVRELQLASRKLFDLLLFDPLHEKGRKPAYWVLSVVLSCLALLHLRFGPRASLLRLMPILASIALALALAIVFFALPRYKIVFDPFLCVFAANTLYGLAGPRLASSASYLRRGSM